jgi:hypothetical protein
MTAPATFDVTITVNAVDVTAFVPLDSMAFTDNARQVSTFDFTISNPTGVTPARGHEVIVTANSLAGTPVIFIGYIMELASKKRDNGITKEYEVRCADRKILLQKSVIGDNLFTGSDFDILADLLANTYPDLSSYFDFGTDITSFADGLEFPTPDGMNLLDALNDLADLTGADWRVETVTGDSASITFDDGTYTDYVLQTGTGMSSGGETATGNPGDAFQGTSGAAAADQFIQIKITLSAAIDVYDISFDGYMDAPGGAATARPRIILYLAGGQVFNSANVTGILPNDGSWYTVTASIDFTANPGDDWTAAPYNCDEIWILNSVSGAYSSSDMRLDNILINPGAGEPTSNLQWDEDPQATDFDIDVQAGDEFAFDIDLFEGDYGDFNSVTVIGGYEDVAVDWTYAMDGGQNHLGLEMPITSLVVYTNSGTDVTPAWGSALALGAWGTDTRTSDGGTKDVLYDANDHWLYFDTEPPNLVYSVRITGTIRRPIRVRVESVGEGELTLATSYTDEKITSLDQAVAIGQAQLNQRDSVRRMDFKTYHPGLKAGQAINVVDSARGLDETLVIQTISVKWIGQIAEFDVHCGDAEDLSLDAMIANTDKRSRQIASNVSPDTQTAYILTSDNIAITSNGQAIYSIG